MRKEKKIFVKLSFRTFYNIKITFCSTGRFQICKYAGFSLGSFVTLEKFFGPGLPEVSTGVGLVYPCDPSWLTNSVILRFMQVFLENIQLFGEEKTYTNSAILFQ
jgi:hypothetical protein